MTRAPAAAVSAICWLFIKGTAGGDTLAAAAGGACSGAAVWWLRGEQATRTQMHEELVRTREDVHVYGREEE